MKQVFSDVSPKLLALFLGLVLSMSAFAQIQVKGLVKDDLGEPLPGAKVATKSGDVATVTDFNGNFQLTAPKGSTLVVSFIGFVTQEVTASSNVVVTLVEDAKALEEVVAIGYAKVKKSDATGSVTAIKPDELTKGVTTNATDLLLGKVAGVQVSTAGGAPGGGASIRIRGGSSLSASNDPLIVIDGLAMDNNGVQGLTNPLSLVNPSDIETFTVLKDASATAIYGSRASNGVIIITTKKGEKGSPVRISYNGNVSVSQPVRKYDVLDGNQYRSYLTQLTGKSVEELGLGTANTKWQDEIYHNAVSSDHTITLSGGLKHMPYRFALGFTGNRGIIKNDKFQRTTASLNLTPSLADDHLTLNINAKGMYAENRYTDQGGIVGSAIAMDPTRPIFADPSEFYATGGYYQTLISSGQQGSWSGQVTNTNTPQNPVAQNANRYDDAASTSLIGSIDAEYKIHGLEDLSIHASASGDYSEGEEFNQYTPYSWGNNYYAYWGRSQSYKYNIQGNAYAQYAHNWNEKHDFSIMAGAEEQHFHRNTFSYGGGDHLGETWVGDYTAAFDPETETWSSNYHSASYRAQTQHINRYSLVSFFGRLNYTLLGRYMLTATMRFDGSSRFDKDNRWGKFPSVALGWKINEEKFMKNLHHLDELKLRLSYGITGQQDLGIDYYYTPRYVTSDQYAQYTLGQTSYYTMRPEVWNSDLKWEKTTTYNVGVDWSILNGRIDGAFDYYYRKTEDLLASVSVASGTNFGNYMIKNIGSLRNTGVEFMINARPVVKKNFTWQIGYNVTWNDNELTKLTTGSDWALTGNSIGAGLSNQVQVNKVGYPVGSFYVYQQVYDANGKPLEGVFVDRNGDGQINPDDKYPYKKPAADVTMGMTNKFIWKNWDFSFTLRASLNNYLYYDFLSNNANVSYSGLFSNGAYRNTMQEAIDLGFSGKTDYYMSDYFVRNASFLRCDNINLGYSFNKLFASDHYKGLNGRIFVTVQNPFVITKYDGIDPECQSGVDSSIYPRPVTYMLGVSLNL